VDETDQFTDVHDLPLTILHKRHHYLSTPGTPQNQPT